MNTDKMLFDGLRQELAQARNERETYIRLSVRLALMLKSGTVGMLGDHVAIPRADLDAVPGNFSIALAECELKPEGTPPDVKGDPGILVIVKALPKTNGSAPKLIVPTPEQAMRLIPKG